MSQLVPTSGKGTPVPRYRPLLKFSFTFVTILTVITYAGATVTSLRLPSSHIDGSENIQQSWAKNVTASYALLEPKDTLEIQNFSIFSEMTIDPPNGHEFISYDPATMTVGWESANPSHVGTYAITVESWENLSILARIELKVKNSSRKLQTLDTHFCSEQVCVPDMTGCTGPPVPIYASSGRGVETTTFTESESFCALCNNKYCDPRDPLYTVTSWELKPGEVEFTCTSIAIGETDGLVTV